MCSNQTHAEFIHTVKYILAKVFDIGIFYSVPYDFKVKYPYVQNLSWCYVWDDVSWGNTLLLC